MNSIIIKWKILITIFKLIVKYKLSFKNNLN